MGSSRRGGWELWTVWTVIALGLVCAVGIVSMGFLGGRNSVLLAKSSGGEASLVRARQAWAIAGGKSRSGGTGLLGRLISLATNETENMTASNSTMNGTDSTMNETNSTGSLPCTSWRGCPHMVVQALPEDIRFECGGQAAGETCYGAMEACVESAEESLRNMYIVSPILATESRKTSVCKCFVSNGCKPSCNVAMYQRWSVGSGMNCPKDPPQYHRATGVYQYGDRNSDYVPASDLSFDYFPEVSRSSDKKKSRA